jgi:hypothetical protein
MAKNKIKINFMLYLVITFIFIIPLSIDAGYADEGATTTDKPPVDRTPSGTAKGDLTASCQFSYSVKDSFIMSALTLCIPGILEKVQKLRQIRCDEVVCEYDATLQNIDSSFCSMNRAYSECKYVVGELFALPFLNIVEILRNVIYGVLSNPIGYALSFGVIAARKYVEKKCASGVCNGAKDPALFVSGMTIIITDGLSIAKDIEDMSEYGFKEYFWDEADNSCEEVWEIKDEIGKFKEEYAQWVLGSPPPAPGE